jgi:hypothetical protein
MATSATAPVVEWDANGQPVSPSASLPATEWDSSGKPIAAAPASDPGWSIGSVLSGTDPAHQAFDKATQTVPVDTSSIGKLMSSLGTNLGAGATRILTPIVHPLNTVAGIAQTGRAALGNVGDQYDLAQKAITPFVQNPSGEAVAAIPQAALALAGGGEAGPVARAVDDSGGGGGIVPAAGGAAKQLASKVFPSFVDGTPEDLLTRAIKPGKNNTGWNDAIQQALPQMKSAEVQLGHPVTGVDDALQTANLAKKQIWQQYQQRLGPAAATGTTIDGNQIADAMMNSIDKRTAAQNPSLVAKIEQTADTYRRPMSLTDAEDFLQSTNAELNTYYAKNKVGQQVAQNDPQISPTIAEGDALRSALYSKLDTLSGPGAAQLKQAYGSLTNVQKELYGRQLVAMRQNPVSLAEQISTAKGIGTAVKGAGQVLTGNVMGGIGSIGEGAGNIVTSQAMKNFTSSDSMIARAFKAAQPAEPFPAPTFRPPQTTNLLPAQAGGKIPLMAPDPGMSQGERVAALMQQLRKSPQPALPANAQPIRLPAPQ